MASSDKECDITLVFDGGSLGNPGKGYGSFHLADRTGFASIERLDFGDDVTNNQAEYRTFIAGLQAAIAHANTQDLNPMSHSICVKTDSKLVVEQVSGRWKVKHPGLQPLCLQARQLLARFGRSDIAWQPRSKTVKLLGH